MRDLDEAYAREREVSIYLQILRMTAFFSSVYVTWSCIKPDVADIKIKINQIKQIIFSKKNHKYLFLLKLHKN